MAKCRVLARVHRFVDDVQFIARNVGVRPAIRALERIDRVLPCA